jgi:hypothetical protein
MIKQFRYIKYYILETIFLFYYFYFLNSVLYFYTLNEVEEKQRNKNIHVKYTRFHPQVFPK